MEEESSSEKRFHAVMDKLFHASAKSTPPPTTSFSSTHIAQKRPNMSSALALMEPKSKGSAVDALPKSCELVQGPPPCRPWDRADLLRRMATFKSMTWFAKPQVVSAVNCSRRGWINVDIDVIVCEACGARLLFSIPSSWTQKQVENAALVFSLKLNNGHKCRCPWVDNACDEALAQFPPKTHADLVDDYKKRFSALLPLLALPMVSSSAIDYMSTPKLEYFLRGSLTIECDNNSADTSRIDANESEAASVLYYQARKLISLCGWEPRSLNYIVDYKDGHDQSTSISVHPSGADDSMEATSDFMECGERQSDPNSVVLDCRLCGASVGLWAFSKLPRPTEFLRVVGYAEVNGESDAVHHKEDELYSGSEMTERYRRPVNLSLTIAGGPLPAKQNYRARISLPVFGENLRDRLSSDSDFTDHLFGEIEGDKDHIAKTLEATSTPDSIVENHPIAKTQNVAQGSKLPENAENCGLVSPAEGDLRSSEVGESSTTATDAHFTFGNSDASEYETILQIAADVCFMQQDPGIDTIVGKQVDSQDGTEVEARVQPSKNNVVAHCTGKDLKRLPLEKSKEFDPIRQHRHFCPWIASSSNSAPGWQQTLCALERQKEFSSSVFRDAPSPSSLIEVDDPIASVRKLFTSPAKRMKHAHGKH